jgi:pimeloyl-ACP methyl ester carboxylesterase
MSEIAKESFSFVRLRDGRALAYLQVGAADGFPVFYFHGHGSSRLEVRFFAEAAADCGVRLIGLDRPGIGRSDAKLGAGLLDWPDDVAAVADALGIGRFAVAGFSAGGPYALACAYKIPSRLTACGLACVVSPPDLIRRAGPVWMRAVWSFAAALPGLFRGILRIALPDSPADLATVERRILWQSGRLCWADKTIMRTPELRRILAESFVESRRQGGKANRDEAMNEGASWEFAYQRVTFENLFLWHGEQDRVMPVAAARLLAKVLPSCAATFYPREGHLSLLINHGREVFGALRG